MVTGTPGIPDSADGPEAGGLSPVALELRVHGVHNTPPTSMLGIDKGDLVQVAGDNLTGFYRSRAGLLPYRVPKAGLAVEAYSWGALTSGARGVFGWVQRALWLLLLPFALANMAYWARLGLGRGRPESRLGASAVRVSSLLLTVFFVVTAATVFIDLVGWQCYRGGSPACPGLPSYLDWLGRRTPGQRLAIGALGPLLVVLVFALLTNKSLSRYESTADPLERGLRGREHRDERDTDGLLVDTRPEGQVLLHPDLWNGSERTRILRDAHVAAAMATVVAFLGGHVVHVWYGGSAWRLGFAVLVGVALVVLALAVVVVSVTLPGDVEAQLLGRAGDVADRDPAAWSRRGPALVGLASAVTVALLGLLAFCSADGFDELQDFFGRNAWFILIFIALTALHLCVFAGGRLSGRLRVVVPLGVAGLLAVGCAIVYWPVWRQGSDGPSGARVVIVLLVVLAAFSVLAGWHYSLARDTRQRVEQEVAGGGIASERDHTIAGSAFAGAGASVLLAAAAWTALLFATSAVIGSANVLNGGAPVTTLQTQLPRSELPAQVPSAVQGVRPDLTVSGRVVVSGAVYAVLDGRLVVYSGEVKVTGAWRGDPRSGRKPLRALPTGGRYGVETVALPDSRVVIKNSCDYAAVPLQQATSRGGSYVCQQGGPDFHAEQSLDVPTRVLAVDAPTTGVRLALTRPGYTPLVVPQVMVWSPVAQTLWLALVALAVILCVVRFGPARAEIRGDEGAYEQVPTWDRGGARSSRAGAAFAHRAERILDVVGFVTSPVALVLVIASSLGRAPWELVAHTRPLADVSLYVVMLAAGLFVILGSRIRSSDSVRRAVGVIWDVATFWPRAAHPLAPPCYAERIVPEISRRVMWAHEVSGTRTVVLSGHSQGSLVVATVAARLPRLDRIRLITYGSQVRALYGRFFPAVFGPDVIGYETTTGPMMLGRAEPDLATPVGRTPAAAKRTLRARLRQLDDWTNLFRRTDPLGFRVFSDRDSAVDVPTLEVPVAQMGDPGPPVKGHSDYQHTPEYRARLREWTRELAVGTPTSTTDVLPLPPP